MVNSKKLISNLWRPDPDSFNRESYYRFDKNERVTLFTPDQFNNIISSLTPYDLVAYGELEPFYKKICEWLKLNRNNVLLTSGSDVAIKSAFETYLEKEDEVLISLPNYAMYSVYTQMFGGKEVQHFYEKDLTIDIKGFIKKISSKTKLIIISNPGHTGSIISEKDLFKILEVAKHNNSILIVDEAYHHFYRKTMVPHIKKYNNLLVIRTFSKAFGLASIRIGLLIGAEEVIKELYKVKLVHEITGLAAKIGIFMLEHLDIVDQYVHTVSQGKNVIYSRLKKLDFKVLESKANFIFFKSQKTLDNAELKKYMLEKNCLISGPFLKQPFDGHLRVTVGDELKMNYFCDILELFLNKQ